MKITPKTFVAVCDFGVGSAQFAAGDVVPHGRLLAHLLAFGDMFVTEAKSPPGATNQPKKKGA